MQATYSPNSPPSLKHYWPLQNQGCAINNLNSLGSFATGVVGTISNQDYPFKDAECHYCKKRGHIAKVCRARAKAGTFKKSIPTNEIIKEEYSTADVLEDATYSLYKTSVKNTDPIMV